MTEFIHALEIRLLGTGDYLMQSCDRVEGGHCGWWLSPRMVRVSAAAADAVLAANLAALLPTSRIIGADEADEKALLRNLLKFSGCASQKQLDSNSKMVFAQGRGDGRIALTPTRYQHRQGFAHDTARTVSLSLDSSDFVPRLKMLLQQAPPAS